MTQTKKNLPLKVVLAGIICGAGMLCAVRALAGENDWPQWRGPQGQGISKEKGLPTEWSDVKNVLWKTKIPGYGHSSPIVWGNRIFLTTAIEGEEIPGYKRITHPDAKGEEYIHPDSMGADHLYRLEVLSIDRDTGKILWRNVNKRSLIRTPAVQGHQPSVPRTACG